MANRASGGPALREVTGGCWPGWPGSRRGEPGSHGTQDTPESPESPGGFTKNWRRFWR